MHTKRNPPTKHKFIKVYSEFFKLNWPWDKRHDRFRESFIWKANHRKLFTSRRLIIFWYFCLIFPLKPAGLGVCVLNSILYVFIIFPVCQDHWVWIQFSERSHTLSCLPMEESTGEAGKSTSLWKLFVSSCL